MRSAPNAARNAARFVRTAVRASAFCLLAVTGAVALVAGLCLAAKSPHVCTALSFAAVGIVVSVKELKEKAAGYVNRMKRLNAAAAKEDRDLSTEEQKKYDTYQNRVKKLLNRAKRQEELDGFENLGGDDDDPPAGGRNKKQNLGGLPDRITVRENRDPGMRGFANQREFLQHVINAYSFGQLDNRLKPLIVKNAAGSDEQSTQSDPYGGFFVPASMLPGWLKVDPEPDPMLGRLTNLPMQSPMVKINARVDKNHTSSVSGGLTVTRRIETQSGSDSRMQTEQIELKADSLYGLTYASEELLSDSPLTIAALLSQGFRDEFQAHLVEERLRGTGVGEFLGALNSPCLISVAKEQSQTADTINGTNLLKMRARCWRYNQAVWLYNPDAYVQLATVHVAGTNGDVFLFNPSRGIDVPDMLLGRPAFPSDFCSTLGDQGDIVLGNWSQFLEGTYQPLEGAESIHVRFLQNERTFRFTMRNAGAPWWRSAYTPRHSTSTRSPFVTLDERAAG